jgi:hypothetical protein
VDTATFVQTLQVLPVLKGSQIIFDLSSERGYDDDAYYSVVGSLYQGRAQAVGTFLVQSNTGANVQASKTVVHAGK